MDYIVGAHVHMKKMLSQKFKKLDPKENVQIDYNYVKVLYTSAKNKDRFGE